MTIHFYAEADGDPPLSWQWQGLEPGEAWENLSDDDVFSGTNGSALAVTFDDTSLDGWWFRAIVSNSCDTLTTGSAVLTITNGTAVE